jgi:AraC-like DNA-binding protein
VGALATEVGWSRRHLTDQFTAEYGFGPKEMGRVLRFERSKQLFIRPDHPTLATIAAECGYADQSHMAREWRSLAGASPTQWLAAEQLPVQHADTLDGA